MKIILDNEIVHIIIRNLNITVHRTIEDLAFKY